MAGTTINPYRFGGQVGYRRDAPSRQYVRARHLDTGEGRWISRDPIGFWGRDWNLARYVRNNPARLMDPSGLLGSLPVLPHPSAPGGSVCPITVTKTTMPPGTIPLGGIPYPPCCVKIGGECYGTCCAGVSGCPSRRRPRPPVTLPVIVWTPVGPLPPFWRQYGRCCGYNARGSCYPSGRPATAGVDFIDDACCAHDCCIATWREVLRHRIPDCDVKLCAAAQDAQDYGCNSALNPQECRKAAATIELIICGLHFGSPIVF